MSSHPHFPIISTTPPPLDINDNNSEDEDDFASFNNVLPENNVEFNDFSFSSSVVEDVGFNTKDNDCIVSKESFHSKIDENSKKLNDQTKSNNCINNSIDCDNNIAIHLNPNNESTDKISVKSIEFPDPETDCSLSAEEPNHHNGINDEENSLAENNIIEEDVIQEFNEIEVDDSQNNLTDMQPIDLKVDNLDEQEPTDVFRHNDLDKLEDSAKHGNHFEDDDDFADFASFKFTDSEEIAAAAESEKQIEEHESHDSLNKSETSFGDFSSSNFNNSWNASNNVCNEESDDDFADFASADPVNTNFETVSHFNKTSSKFHQNDGEFADFASFQDNNNQLEHERTIKQEPRSESSIEGNKLCALFTETFETSETEIVDENSISIPRDLFHNAEQNSISLWKRVQNLEDAPSLKLRWPNSHCFQLLLAALKIDPRNILRNSSVPMFASGLGHVLEPTKHTINSDSNSDNTVEQHENRPESTNPSSVPIPPVQFDWSSSGLTNPLDVNQKSMVSFDLDFFVTNDDVKNTTKQVGISSFEEELLNDNLETNSKVDSISGDSDSANGRTNIVQQILSTIKSTSANQLPDRNQVLSAEALQVLDELPNLSFMRAKVLMFPIIKSETIPTDNELKKY